MKLNTLFLGDGISRSEYTFGGVTVVASQHNGTGKTTLLRCILYALGYPIPSMRGLAFETMEFELALTTDTNREIRLRRLGSIVKAISQDSAEEQVFSLPAELTDLHRLVFGIEDATVLSNLLGAYYLDQEKGWTLLNRGKVIGNIHFSIEDFLRGLTGRPCTEERNRLATVEEEIRKYRYMLSVADYQADLDESSDSVPSETPVDDVMREILRLRNQRKPLVNEMRRLRMAVKNHNEFREYINSMHLRVKGPNGEPIPVTSATLLDFADMQDLLSAKLADCQLKISSIDNQMAAMEKKQENTNVLFTVETKIQRFAEELSRVHVDVPAVERILSNLQKQRKKLKDILRDALSREQIVVKSLAKTVVAYLKEFGIDEQLGGNIFTNDLKSISGALFHLQVFAFKISYAKLVREKTGCVLPLIIDSPNGREVEKDTVEKMLKILLRDFSDHQIIIATIYNPDLPSQKTIELSNGVMSLTSEAPIATKE